MSYYYNKITGGLLNTSVYADSNNIPSLTDDDVSITETEYNNILTGTYKLIESGGTFGIQAAPPPTNQEKVLLFFASVNSFINDAALNNGYDDILDAISYKNSGITAWREEAEKFISWRDNTKSLMYSNIHSFTADGITLPSLTGGSFTAQSEYVPLGITSPSRPLIL